MEHKYEIYTIKYNTQEFYKLRNIIFFQDTKD